MGCDQAGVRIQVTADVDLDPSCTYTAGLDVRASGVTLDCKGAWISSSVRSGYGIGIRTPADVDLHDVTVRNCNVRGFMNAIRVTRDGFKGLPTDHEYDHGTARIAIEDGELTGSAGVGIYVDAYVTDVAIRHMDVHDAGSTGVYLETGSRRNLVESNSFTHNGYAENGEAGQPTDVGGTTVWFWGIGREGVAVDGSYDNVIRGNDFSRNSAGGVFLYKNCGEYKDDPSWIPRRWGADRNTIEGNHFDHEWVGVWVASRMGENILPMDCSDPAYLTKPGARYVLDVARDNVVAGNDFAEVEYGVRVEDDRTTVSGNSFTSTTRGFHAIYVGTPYRTTVLGRPVSGTRLVGNRATLAGNASPYRWSTGQAATTASGNTALGAPAGICQGPPIPRGPFVFTLAVALPGPGGTAPPRPAITWPQVGELAPCARSTTTTTAQGQAGGTSTSAPGAGGGTAPAATPVAGDAAYAG
ncbi:MAG: right-handed parallel beta-helix repeat-containing protein [Acidimicrobiales bacterium]